ncbi:MAG: viral replication protein [Defluviitaleaceae bacterium]|nr:viral replication protein [Defluviitaleaceae bacterium]
MDTMRRKYFITCNNPLEHDLSHEKIKSILEGLASVKFWAMADEIGKEGTPHTHIVIYSESPIRHSTMRNAFNGKADVEPVKTSVRDCIEYIKKEGSHEETEGEKTSVEGTYVQWGMLPLERQGKRSDMIRMVELIEDGATNEEIRFLFPSQYLRYKNHIEKTRQDIKEEQYRNIYRKLEVVYISGLPNTGKTSYVLEKYGYENACHIAHYRNPMIYDSYNNAQDVLCLDEFASQIPIFHANAILQGYPTMLHSRYADKVACYTRVYIVSNLPLHEQYKTEQTLYPEIWQAFLRRIHKVVQFMQDGKQCEYTREDFINGVDNWVELPANTPTPFVSKGEPNATHG